MNEIEELIAISRFYGQNSDYVIAGGGNTSFKTADRLYVKASGVSMGNIDENGFAVLDRAKLECICSKRYSNNPEEREQEIKEDLMKSCVEPKKLLRPSVETSMHNLINYRFVVHTHPTMVNALLCSQNAEVEANRIFGDDAVYVPYIDPGYSLFKEIEFCLRKYRDIHSVDPHIILLENHGIFVSADSVDEIKRIYDAVVSKIGAKIANQLKIESLPVDDRAKDILRAIHKQLSVPVALIRNNTLISKFCEDFQSIAPFTPDIIVYCKAYPVVVENALDIDRAIVEIKIKFEEYFANHGYQPKIVILKGLGLVGLGDSNYSADIALDVFEDLMKITLYSKNFGGPHFLNDTEIAFIENWEVENYRRSLLTKTVQ